MKVHIHTAADTKQVRSCERQYGYIIRPEGKEGYSEGFGSMEGSYQASILKAITEALDRFSQYDKSGRPVSCDVVIHSQDKRIIYHAQNSMEKHWQFNGWKNARGEEIKNRKLWEGLYNKLRSYPSYHFTWEQENKSITGVIMGRIRDNEVIGSTTL